MSDISLQPDPSRVIESLRDTGYSFETAIADVIDNSIAADASVVRLYVNLLPGNNIVPYVAIVDNGCGMDDPGLQNAMRYGSERRTNPSSLGKFGLGLKTASTAFCRKLSVLSRGPQDPTVRKYQWDLDYVATTGQWLVRGLAPSQDEVELLDETADGKTGTLVIWENIDRLFSRDYIQRGAAENRLKQMCDSLRFHLGVVFQRFLDTRFADVPNIKLYLNGVLVEPWDPFCTTEPNTDVLTNTGPVLVKDLNGEEANLTLKAYAIPRSEEFSSKEARDKARISTDTLGFYIYRENRLIHYGDWLNMFKVEPHDSLLRIEFSFDHKLDSSFNIDIKKSRVQLAQELYDYIKGTFMPAPRRAAQDKYRNGRNKAIAKTAATAHQESNNNIEAVAPSAEQASITVKDPDRNLVELQNKNGTFTQIVVIETTPNPTQCRVIPKDDLPNGVLWEPCIADGKHAVRLNTSHDYYQKIYYPLYSKNIAVIGMDALLWALAEAEHATYNDQVKEVYEDIRVQVSLALRKLVRDLPDPELPGSSSTGDEA